MGIGGGSRTRRSRWLVRGESLIASTALAFAAVILVVTGASAWWMTDALGREAVAERRDEAGRLSSVIASSAETLLAAGELSSLRRVVMESARVSGVRACRVVLPDGRIVADSDPSRIEPGGLPEAWAGHPGDGGEEFLLDAGLVVVRQVIDVPGRGAAVCELEVSTAGGHDAVGPIRAGAVVSGAAGLAMMLLVYRRFRTRLGAIGAIREALLALTRGESDTESLIVDEAFGPEAGAWNMLLGEREELRRRDLRDRVEQSGPGAAARGDPGAVCDLLADGLVLIDRAGVVTYANGAAGLLLGVTRDELVGARVPAALAEGEVGEAIAEAARSGSRRRDVVDLAVGDEGGTVLRFGVRAARGVADASVLVSIQDVTQLKLAEDSRNAFVAQATHELRAPLTNIRLYIEQLVDEGEQDAALRARAINVISQETNRLDRIVADMLSVSELEAGSIALREDDIRLDQLFDTLQLDYVAQASDRGIKLKFELPPKLPVIRGDRDKLCLAIHNLISNALKYTPSGGTVTVRVSIGTDESLSVDVIDTGIGIATEQLDKVFERFGRADDERVRKITGSGIGLALARDVARLHGGDITVESVLNQGSTFTLSVPGAPRAKAA